MKLSVLLKAMAKKITWWAAAEIIGVTDRTMRRWRVGGEEGYTGLADRRKGKASAQRIPLAMAEKVLRLYQEAYYDLNIRHFHEKLREVHGIELSCWCRRRCRTGLVAKRRSGDRTDGARRAALPDAGAHRRSKHQWFNDDRCAAGRRDAEIWYRLVEEESTRTVMRGVKEVVETEGYSVHCTAPGAPLL